MPHAYRTLKFFRLSRRHPSYWLGRRVAVVLMRDAEPQRFVFRTMGRARSFIRREGVRS